MLGFELLILFKMPFKCDAQMLILKILYNSKLRKANTRHYSSGLVRLGFLPNAIKLFMKVDCAV